MSPRSLFRPVARRAVAAAAAAVVTPARLRNA